MRLFELLPFLLACFAPEPQERLHWPMRQGRCYVVLHYGTRSLRDKWDSGPQTSPIMQSYTTATQSHKQLKIGSLKVADDWLFPIAEKQISSFHWLWKSGTVRTMLNPRSSGILQHVKPMALTRRKLEICLLLPNSLQFCQCMTSFCDVFFIHY